MAEHFRLLFTQRRVLPLALAFAALGVYVSTGWVARAVCAGFALLALAAAWLQQRAHPALILDDDGYAVVEYGREKLRVGWREVQHVRADAAEHALYVDCGDPARNLLVPPRRGYGFRFERSEELFQRVCAAVPDKVESVARLDPVPPKRAP